MNPRFVDHARERLLERGITAADVESVLRRPMGDPVPGNRPDTVVLHGYASGGRMLKVVVDSTDRELVVSAMWKGARR